MIFNQNVKQLKTEGSLEADASRNSALQLKDNRTQSDIQLKLMSEIATSQSIQKKSNNTGLPDNLKSVIESLSGYSMDDVKVHYNSPKPEQLNAHAYAQGTNIHMAPGQEKHLPHEAWHVVQQKQGRVKPTMQMKGKVNINDDSSLEKEADVMGSRALQRVPVIQNKKSETVQNIDTGSSAVVIQRLTQAQRDAINQRIALNQAVVNANRNTINAGRQGGWNLRAGMRRHVLQALIAALNRSIPARQAVLADNNLLGNPDVGGGHAAQIVREQGLRTEAQDDLATLNHHGAGAWAPIPGTNRERRTRPRWDRDPVQYEERIVQAAADAAAGWHVVQPGRRH